MCSWNQKQSKRKIILLSILFLNIFYSVHIWKKERKKKKYLKLERNYITWLRLEEKRKKKKISQSNLIF